MPIEIIPKLFRIVSCWLKYLGEMMNKIRLVVKFSTINALLLIALFLPSKFSYADSGFEGSISPIPQALQKKMIGNTWHAGCPVGLNDLSYLKLSYWGFDNKPHQGELIINQKLAIDTLDIFKQLYEAHFPIEKMVVPENLIGDKKFPTSIDLAFYLDNSDDTNAFSCRVDGQRPNDFSPHSLGIAIDINPYYNPAIIAPQYMNRQQGRKYLDRKLQHMGTIAEGDFVFTTFLNHGWEWGGFFDDGVDYMHFQKVIRSYFMADRLTYIPPLQRLQKVDSYK